MNNIKEWEIIIEKLDFAFQPIVNIRSGTCFGVEALLRKFEDAGFASIQDIFDRAYKEKVLYRLELGLRKKAIAKFLKIENYDKFTLFLNVDNRVLEMPDYSIGNTLEIINKQNIVSSAVCFELSEKYGFSSLLEMRSILNLYKNQNYKIAIDDFGVGFSGLEFLYHAEPNFIKIDRFFISDIEKDSKKRLFTSNIINIAHVMGIFVIAEGVETEKEFLVCKEIGADFIQGYFVQKPTLEVKEIEMTYKNIIEINSKEKRDIRKEEKIVQNWLEYITPINFNTPMTTVFEIFKKNKDNYFFPVVDDHNEPLGIIREKDIKEYVFSPYGKEILKNKTSGKKLKEFIHNCSVAEVSMKIDRILEIFSNEDAEGVIITENSKYLGFLSSKSLIKVVNERNIAIARDQNPLTKMAGNNLINDYISETLMNKNENAIFVYFDFDNFKPFNDKYGFRLGDRAILMFADILKDFSNREKCFVGHIGGDDFFMGFRSVDLICDKKQKIKEIIDKFKDNVVILYSDEDRENGYIKSKDREGNKKKFPLLTVSAVMLNIDKNREVEISPEEIGAKIASLKSIVKNLEEKIIFENIYSKNKQSEVSCEC